MSFPDVSEVLWDLGTPVVFTLAKKQVVDGLLTEGEISDTQFEGVIEPMPTSKLVIKPEGQRRWQWWTMWATQILKQDSIVQDDEGRQYRVMSVDDWSRNGGYYSYELTQAING